ncbi:HEAT repeat domain-containing protein [Desulfococcus sp.]|uniref:HEAT repeat domain-containing protein n=1 Tax=Desulfococcus sp. TaxID=2025834 RepID=UPI0035943824
MDRDTAKALKRLRSKLIFWGGRIRKKGAEGLYGTDEPDAVAPLIFALGDPKEQVRFAARAALGTLQGRAIDRFCEHWAESRGPTLKDIILETGYIASDPIELMVLTSFVNGKDIEFEVPEEVLKTCLLDAEEEVVKQAAHHIVKHPTFNNSKWILPFLIEQFDNGLFQTFNAEGWHPERPDDRALFFFLAGDFEKYNDIDFEHKHLRYWYETAEPKLKEAIAAGIRQSGQKSLLAVFLTERGSRKQKLSEAEVELQVEILTRKKDFPALFGLLPFTTCDQGLRIVAAAQEAGWQNPARHGHELQQRLEALLKDPGKQHGPSSVAMKIFQDFRPMLMGSKKPPGDAGGLNSWLSDAGNFRRRSAALIHMAETSVAGLKEAANRACGDGYWQVRMAAAACELLHPGTLSPANKALLEDDHVYWVQTFLKMPLGPGPGRLADLGPDGLERLRRLGRRSDPKVKPEGPDDFLDLLRGLIHDSEAEYMLTLGEFLITDVVVREETAYAASETDIEIEMDE